MKEEHGLAEATDRILEIIQAIRLVTIRVGDQLGLSRSEKTDGIMDASGLTIIQQRIQTLLNADELGRSSLHRLEEIEKEISRL